MLAVVLDVRDELRRGGRPLMRILRAAKGLPQEQHLVVLATFEPIPLYAAMRLRGFRHEARRLPGGDWEVRFRRGRGEAGPAAAPDTAGVAPAEGQAPYVCLDNRGLQPPEPMMRTLEALGRLEAGAVLEIHNDRAPQFLYPHLVARGYRHQTLPQPDGSAFVRIWRAAGDPDSTLHRAQDGAPGAAPAGAPDRVVAGALGGTPSRAPDAAPDGHPAPAPGDAPARTPTSVPAPAPTPVPDAAPGGASR